MKNTQKTRPTLTNNLKLLIVALLIFIVGFCCGDRSYLFIRHFVSFFNPNASLNVLDYKSSDEVYRQLVNKYDGDIDTTKLMHGINKGLVAALGDRHTVYFTPEEAKNYNMALSGKIGGGIGAEIGMHKNSFVVLRPLKDNPAFRAGILAGDTIYKINDEEIDDQMALESVVQKIRGEAGTQVKLTILRDGEPSPKEITITREIITNPSVSLAFEEDVAILTISRFDLETAKLATTMAQEINQKNIKKLVIDLRDNTGGYLQSAVDLLDLWLDGKKVVIEKVNNQVKKEFFTKQGKAIFNNMTTVVLANKYSASASEIVMGALRDYNEAVIMGETSYGKGSVQELITLPQTDAQLKITIARWFTPNGNNIDGTGIKPDYEVVLDSTAQIGGVDNQMQSAIIFLNK